MHRRTFCILTYTALAGALLPFLSCSKNDSPLALHSRLSRPTALAFIGDAATVTELGNAYLHQVETENTADRLVGLLMVNTDNSPIPAATGESTLQRLMAEKVQFDFETGETVVVNGWVLSRTEARQCALFSIIQSGG